MSHLYQELRDSPDIETVLLRYAGLIAEDPELAKLYHRLGFSQAQRCFLVPPSRELALALFSKDALTIMHKSDIYLELEAGDWDVHRGGRSQGFEPSGGVVDDSDFGLPGEFPEFPEEEQPAVNCLWKMEPTSSSLPEHHSPSPPVPRGNKGLKKLSIAVKGLVTIHGALTYKEVADRLISTMDDSEAEKEEKNIRRRVYDALNVLIAADVLTKQGKEVRLKPTPRLAPISESDETQKRLLGKQKQLKTVTEQYKALNALMMRNQKLNPRNRVGMPFVIMATRKTSQDEVSNYIDPDQDRLRAQICSNKACAEVSSAWRS